MTRKRIIIQKKHGYVKVINEKGSEVRIFGDEDEFSLELVIGTDASIDEDDGYTTVMYEPVLQGTRLYDDVY